MKEIKELLKKIKEEDSFSDTYNVDHRMLRLVEAMIIKIEEMIEEIDRNKPRLII
jgi:hypothetical protein